MYIGQYPGRGLFGPYRFQISKRKNSTDMPSLRSTYRTGATEWTDRSDIVGWTGLVPNYWLPPGSAATTTRMMGYARHLPPRSHVRHTRAPRSLASNSIAEMNGESNDYKTH